MMLTSHRSTPSTVTRRHCISAWGSRWFKYRDNRSIIWFSFHHILRVVLANEISNSLTCKVIIWSHRGLLLLVTIWMSTIIRCSSHNFLQYSSSTLIWFLRLICNALLMLLLKNFLSYLNLIHEIISVHNKEICLSF